MSRLYMYFPVCSTGVVSDHAQTGTYNDFMNRQVRWAKLLAPTDRAPESAERSESRHMEGDHGAKGNVL